MNQRLRQLCFAAALILAVKLVAFALDARPALFLGDSGSYLATAAINYIPPDRSFTYGYLLKLIALWPRSLERVVVVQIGTSLFSCCILAWLLIRYFEVGWRTMSVLVALCALEPLQLLSERYILTEATATLLFALLVWLAFAYARSGKDVLLLLVAVVSVFLISVRISFLPLVIIYSLSLPWLPRGRRVHRILIRVGLLVCVSQLLFYGYRHLYRHLYNPSVAPAYLYADGYFLLSSVAPLVIPADYPIAAERAWLFQHVTVPLADPQNRDNQRWASGGLSDVIAHTPGIGEYSGNKLARQTALRAIRRNPVGFLRLALITAASYFDTGYLSQVLQVDEGYGRTWNAQESAFFRRDYRFQYRKDDEDSRLRRWHRAAKFWYSFLIFVPELYAAALVFFWRRTNPTEWLLLATSVCLWATAVITVERPTPRYLTALAWLVFLLFGSVSSLLRPPRPLSVEQ